MIRKMFMLWSCLALLCGAVHPVVAAEIGDTLTSLEVTTLLTDKTFFVQQLRSEGGGHEKVNDFHVYFSPTGSMQINYTARHIKTGKWGVGDGGELCFNFAVPAGSKKRVAKRCGVLIKRGPYDFARYNNEGVHLSTLTLVDLGNKFP